MKYKVGDKVKIKTWKEIKKEYKNCSSYYRTYPDAIHPNSPLGFHREMDHAIEKLKTHRIVEIKEVKENSNEDSPYYTVKEISCYWSFNNNMIKYRIDITPIFSRFDLLDLRL